MRRGVYDILRELIGTPIHVAAAASGTESIASASARAEAAISVAMAQMPPPISLLVTEGQALRALISVEGLDALSIANMVEGALLAQYPTASIVRTDGRVERAQ